MSQEADFPEVEKLVKERTQQRIHWYQGLPEDDEVRKAIRDLIRVPLTADSAVKVALLNNRSLQATYEDLGIAQADVVQSGLLKNPVLFASARFPNKSPSRTNLEFGIVQSFLDLLMLPARTRIASDQFERTKMKVAHEVLEKVSEVNVAFYSVVGARQIADMRKMISESAGTSFELAKRMHDAGNINDLSLANEESLHEQTKMDWSKAEEEALATREKLTRLLGLWGSDTEWTAVQGLPDVPKEEVPLEHLESLAVAQRLDLAAGLAEERTLARGLDLVLSYRWIGSLQLGADAERDPDGQWLVGPNLSVELPIFDRQQAVIARLSSQLRQSQERSAALAVEIRSEVRALRNRLMTTRYRINHYKSVVIPLRQRVVTLTQQRYNFMLIGAFELIESKQKEFDAYQLYIEAVRDYWITRAELEKTLHGSLPAQQP